jgi:hypothetical protein
MNVLLYLLWFGVGSMPLGVSHKTLKFKPKKLFMATRHLKVKQKNPEPTLGIC